MRRIFRCFLPSPARATSRIREFAFVATLALLAPVLAFAQANGKLQIHHVNVGQGDGILVISPNGQKALFDDGNYLSCTGIKNYLQGLGITSVDYHFNSHYHSDHLGCIDDLAAIGITVATAGYDRGYSYTSGAYTAYVNTLGAKRQTMTKGQIVTLDAGAANPVQLVCVDLNGAGVYSPTGSDENAKSMVMKVSYGNFQEVIGGDLTGTGSTDVESTIGPECGDVEVYKVHHHGSLYSSNDNWLTAISPEVGIIQVGDGNSYGHPTADALNRMHAYSVHTYWTQTGAGASPNPTWDKVGGTIVVQADPGAGAAYTVSGSGFIDTYYSDGVPPPINTTQVATSMTMIKGSITAGDVTRLAADDVVRVSVGAGVSSGKYLTDWYGSVTLAHPPLNLNITYDGNYTVSRTQTLYLWNWTTSAWVQINSGTVSTTDVTKTWSTTSPAVYVSPTREVRLRVATNTRSSSFTCRGDYMAFTYDYTPGTTPMLVSPLALGRVVEAGTMFAVARPSVDNAHLVRGGAELPLAALHSIVASPSASGIELTWTVPVTEHVDGFNVYREDAAGTLVFAGNESELESSDGIATFRFVDASMKGGAATYWLGARGCSGPEARIGPLRVEPVAAAPLRVAVSPNPAMDFARLSFEVPRAAHARLDIFDVSGRRIATPFEGGVNPGMQQVDWNLSGDHGRVEPGVYFARLQGLGRTMFTRVTVIAP